MLIVWMVVLFFNRQAIYDAANKRDMYFISQISEVVDKVIAPCFVLQMVSTGVSGRNQFASMSERCARDAVLQMVLIWISLFGMYWTIAVSCWACLGFLIKYIADDCCANCKRADSLWNIIRFTILAVRASFSCSGARQITTWHENQQHGISRDGLRTILVEHFLCRCSSCNQFAWFFGSDIRRWCELF